MLYKEIHINYGRGGLFEFRVLTFLSIRLADYDVIIFKF